MSATSTSGRSTPEAIVRSNRRTLSWPACSASSNSPSSGVNVPASLSVRALDPASTWRRMKVAKASQGSPSSSTQSWAMAV